MKKAMAALGLLILVFAIYTFFSLPNVRAMSGCLTTSMYKVRLCPESGRYAKLNEISKNMINAVLVAEDSAFYSHQGFDWFELRRSVSANLRAGTIQRGGSTITQQLAKNVFLYKERSYWRKLKEAYLTYAIERHFSKNQILERYLNVVEFGPGLYGVKDAARHYFQKPPSQLNPLESCYLAFLLPNPKVYSKSFRQGKLTPFARKMVSVLLHRLNRFKKLNDDEYRFAVSALDSFPWYGLADFNRSSELPDLSEEDESFVPPSSEVESKEDVIDEEALENLLKDELQGQPAGDQEL